MRIDNFNPQGSREPRLQWHGSCCHESWYFNPQGSREPRHPFGGSTGYFGAISIHKALANLDGKYLYYFNTHLIFFKHFKQIYTLGTLRELNFTFKILQIQVRIYLEFSVHFCFAQENI